MIENNEVVCYLTIYILVSAEEEVELQRKCKEVEMEMQRQKIKIRHLTNFPYIKYNNTTILTYSPVVSFLVNECFCIK